MYVICLLVTLTAVVCCVSGGDLVVATNTASEYLTDEMKKRADVQFDWHKLKEPEGFKVALDVTSCQGDVEKSKEYEFALALYVEWAKIDPSTVEDKPVQQNGCKCNEVINLFNFAKNKTPHLLNHLNMVFNTVCGSGVYEKNLEKETELLKYLSEKVATETIIYFMTGGPRLVRLYMSSIALTGSEWSLEHVAKQITDEKPLVVKAIEDMKAAAKSASLPQQPNMTDLEKIPAFRTVIKAKIMSYMAALGLKEQDLPSVFISGNVDVWTPASQVVIFESVHGIEELRTTCKTHPEKFIHILNNVSLLISAQAIVMETDKDLYPIARTFLRTLFDADKKKQNWTFELAEKASKAFCKIGLKAVSVKSEADDKAKATEEAKAKADAASGAAKPATEKKPVDPKNNLFHRFVADLASLDQQKLEQYEKDNQASSLDQLTLNGKYLSVPDPLKCL